MALTSMQRTVLGYASQAARFYGLDPAIFFAQLMQEAGMRWDRPGSSGEIGPGQFMAATWTGVILAHSELVQMFGAVSNPSGRSNVVANVFAAAALLSDMLAVTGGNYFNALARYNGGDSALGQQNGINNNYPQLVLGRVNNLGEFDDLDLTGGDGGFGNSHFKSSTNRAPRRVDPGHPGEGFWLWLRLKLIADAGLIGLPNSGKSTFLAACSRARPKVADYPFTTLYPQLGVVFIDDEEFVLADIPGLIEGAHEGAGLGDRFLGHIERCGVLLHLVDGTGEDIEGAYRTVRTELREYGHGLDQKVEIVVLNKCDAIGAEELPRAQS